MKSLKKNKENKAAKKGIPIPAGTEQETGFTRGETEKQNGPVKISPIAKKSGRSK